MNKSEIERLVSKKIIIYYWDSRIRRIEYEGTYKRWFKLQNIKTSNLKNYKYCSGSLGNVDFKFKFNNDDYITNFNHIIKLYLVHKERKYKFIDGYKIAHKIEIK